MENYPNNSHTYKAGDVNRPAEPVQNAHNVKKVINGGGVRIEKKTGLRKVLSDVVADDLSDLKSYVWINVILPAIKRTIADAVDVALNGETRRKNDRYESIYRSSNKVNERHYTSESNVGRRSAYEIGDITLDTYVAADAVLEEMERALATYGLVSVSDLYDILGSNEGTYSDCKYGWTSLRTAKIVPVRNGFALKLPRVIPLN